MSVETRTADNRRDQNGPNNASVYIGKVVNHLDTTYMGGLEVLIQKRTASGNFAENYVQCRYASPFYGQTPYDGLTDNDGYAYTQKSYGFWAVPPDIGTQVIVVMPEGDSAQAFWIGCIPDLGMNFMTPGYSSTTYNDEDQSKALPVGEYNKRQQTGSGNDITKYIKPVYQKEKRRIEAAGLIDDWARGSNSSSARREVPSAVFGWSTPGPPDRNGPKHRYGKEGSSIEAPFNRLGGSSFVMDDGDMNLLRKKPASGDQADKPEFASPVDGETDGDVTLPANDLIRIKTRTGHQIVMHNTEDFIYISHGSGNSWIEMTGNGKIDVYAKDSISFRTENDINFYADRDINFEAKRNFNLNADGSFFLHTGANYEIKADADGKLSCGGQSNIFASTHAETAEGGIFMNSSTAAAEAGSAGLVVRIPAHEPWPDHENLDPKNFVPENTEVKSERQGLLLNGTTDEAPPIPTVPNAFRRPS